MHALLLTLALAGRPVLAQEEGAEAAAEQVRLREELRRLGGRQAWAGVETLLQKMSALVAEGEPLQAGDLDIGADAARARGDLALARKRWEAAQALSPSEGRAGNLADLEARFGVVSLGISDRWDGERALELSELPFAPDERAALTFAQEALDTRGVFLGLLPPGRYSFGGRRFRLRPGDEEVVIWLEDSAPAPGITEAPPPPPVRGPRFTLADARAGLSLSVGGGLAHFGRAAKAGVQPAPFGGPGARVAAGWSLAGKGPTAWLLELSWRGLFHPTEDPTLPTASSHLVSFDVGPELRFGPMRVGGALGLGLAVTKAVGMDAERHTTLCATGADQSLCPTVSASDAADRTVLRASSGLATLGLHGGVGLARVGASELELGLATGLDLDTVRLSPWLSLTVGLRPGVRP